MKKAQQKIKAFTHKRVSTFLYNKNPGLSGVFVIYIGGARNFFRAPPLFYYISYVSVITRFAERGPAIGTHTHEFERGRSYQKSLHLALAERLQDLAFEHVPHPAAAGAAAMRVGGGAGVEAGVAAHEI